MATSPVTFPRERSVAKSSPRKSKTVSKTTKSAPAKTLSYEQFQRLTVIQQVRRAFMPGARLAAVVGSVLGGAIPISTYVIIHHPLGVATYPMLWLLVAGGLLYSAPTVFNWATAAFGSKVKAAGFTLLMEGILTFVHIKELTYLSLGVLVFINVVSAACSLQIRKENTSVESFSSSLSLR
jgi:hypothetical protein